MSQFLPDAPDLMAAIGKVLRDVLDVVPDDRRHEVRVAAHLAEVVERELRLGAVPEPSNPTWEQLVAATRHDLAISKPGYDQWEHG